MSSKGNGVIGVGLLLMVIAAVLAFVIVPAQKVFPADVDVTRHYSIDYLTLLNGETLTFFAAAEGENPNLRIERHIVVEEVEGKQTLIRETQTILDGEAPLTQVLYRYALDRQTMEALNPIPEDWAGKEGLWQRQGINIGWGIGAEKRDYVGWSEDYRHPVTIQYLEEQEYAGIKTYYYKAQSEPEAINPEHATRLGLPAELSIASLATLASGLNSENVELSLPQRIALIAHIEAATRQGLSIPEEESAAIPLEYKYNYTTEYWVDPTTGVLIDIHKTETRGVYFPESIMLAFRQITEAIAEDAPEFVPPDTLEKLLPITVSGFRYQATPETIEDAKAEAASAASRLSLFGTMIPIALVVAGAGLAIWGFSAKMKPAA